MKRWKSIAGVLAVFFLGVLAGAAAMHRVDRHGLEALLSGKGGAMTDLIVRRFSRSLDLDRSQREQVRAIVAETHKEIVEIRKPVQPRIDEAIARSRARVREILRPDQQAKFDRWIAEHRAREASPGRGK